MTHPTTHEQDRLDGGLAELLAQVDAAGKRCPINTGRFRGLPLTKEQLGRCPECGAEQDGCCWVNYRALMSFEEGVKALVVRPAESAFGEPAAPLHGRTS